MLWIYLRFYMYNSAGFCRIQLYVHFNMFDASLFCISIRLYACLCVFVYVTCYSACISLILQYSVTSLVESISSFICCMLMFVHGTVYIYVCCETICIGILLCMQLSMVI